MEYIVRVLPVSLVVGYSLPMLYYFFVVWSNDLL